MTDRLAAELERAVREHVRDPDSEQITGMPVADVVAVTCRKQAQHDSLSEREARLAEREAALEKEVEEYRCRLQEAR